MKKIISLFQRDYEGNRQVFNKVVPGAEWVLAGEGVATRKWDGTCVLVENGKIWKRYEVKKGRKAPYGFRAANDVDENTGKQQGWIEIGNGNEDRWYREATGGLIENVDLPDGTYELVGPKIQGNPEGFTEHRLIAHGEEILENVPRDFEGLKEYLSSGLIEGIVWWHPDGRKVKIKGKDFGFKRLNLGEQ